MQEIITITDGLTLNPGDLNWDDIASLGKIIYYDRTPAELVPERCREATVIVTNKTPIRSETIMFCKNLKMIAVTATGYNIIDLEAAKKRGVIVCNVPGYGTDSVAQHAFALILELSNYIGLNSQSVAQGEWSSCKDFCYTKAPLVELAGKTLGIVGYGSIGRKVGEIGRALGMNVIYSRSQSSIDKDAVSVGELFAASDVVSLHCPLTKQNEKFVNAALLRSMKQNAILINTARGQLINEYDLANALREGWIKAAGLDVLSSEPPPSGHPLIGAPNCVITPHNAWSSFEARTRIMRTTVENIRGVLCGHHQNVITT
jgi:glycerate dehydrogenase